MSSRSAAGGVRSAALRTWRNAALIMVGFVAVLWAVQLVDVATHYSLLRFGIVPRSLSRLGDILSAPFLHVSWTHIESNTPPLFVLGLLVALAGLRRFLAVTAFVIVVAGLGVWLVSPSNTDTVGASGVVFGYLGFLLARGAIERRLLELAVAVAVGVGYWWTLPALLPGNPAVSWQDHLFGLFAGILAAGLWRSRRRAAVPPGAVSSLPGAAGAAPRFPATPEPRPAGAGPQGRLAATPGSADRRTGLFTLPGPGESGRGH